MKSDWTSQRNARLISVVVVSLVALLIFAFATRSTPAQQQGPSTAAKSNGAATQRENIAALLREAASLLQTGKLDEAEPLVRRAVAAAPSNADAHNLLGAILDQRGQTQAAEREYLQALRLNPRATSARANLGVLLARTGRSDQAVQAFEFVLREAPDHPQATVNLGLLYVGRGDYNDAVPLLERARLQQPKNVPVLSQLALALYQLKRVDEASAVVVSAAGLAPDDPDVLYVSGLVAANRGDSEAAFDFWQRALKQRPEFAPANFMIGEELRKQRRYEGAAEFYERALTQDPAQLVYFVRLGGTYMLLVRYDRALELFQRAAQRFPASAEAQYFVGIAARGRGTYDIAEAALRKSLALQPDNFDALAQLGFILGERDHLAEAEPLLRRAIALSNNKHFYAQYDLGRLFVRSKRYEDAIPILQHAAVIRPNNPGVHYQLFMAFSRLKRKEEADRELAIFKRLDEKGKTHRQNDNEIDSDDAANPPANVQPADSVKNPVTKTP